jgi:hypothetical protein
MHGLRVALWFIVSAVLVIIIIIPYYRRFYRILPLVCCMTDLICQCADPLGTLLFDLHWREL